MSNDTRTIDLVVNNLTEQQFEEVFSPDPNELWLTPDDTPEKLAEKVDKTSDPNKIYGTDAQGNQTTYAAPSTGAYVLKCINGVIQWVAE